MNINIVVSLQILKLWSCFTFVRIDESFFKWEREAFTSEESVKIQKSLFGRLCPLLILRLLPVRVFDNLNSSAMYGQFVKPETIHGIHLINFWRMLLSTLHAVNGSDLMNVTNFSLFWRQFQNLEISTSLAMSVLLLSFYAGWLINLTLLRINNISDIWHFPVFQFQGTCQDWIWRC